MKLARIARIFDLVGVLIPGVLELTLLMPMFLGLYYAARALGCDGDLESEAVMGISVTLSWFVWIGLNGVAYSGTESPAEARNESPRDRDSSSVRHKPPPLEACQAIESTAATQPEEEMDSVPGR